MAATGTHSNSRRTPAPRVGRPEHGAAQESIGYAVLGGGPAGLTGAYALALREHPAVVFEADGTVGGIAKTVEFNGYRFDLGGHRFFTKLKQVERMWEHLMGDDFLTRPRLSRIYFAGKYFSYPLTAKDVLGRLGLLESARCALSYLWAQRKRGQQAETFEDWVTARFGKRLYDAFFRSYTQKLWGIPGTEIRSLWAAQRIKNFSLWKAGLTILGLKRDDVSTLPLKDLIRSLDPPPPQEVLDAADRLRYRDFCLVALMTTEAEPFPDNWIYIHDPGTRAGRVQNFGSWSEDMVVPGTTCLGVEYFCFEGDDVWEMSSEDAVKMAKNEMARIGLIDPDKVIDGVKVRVPKAYPTYDLQYEEAVDTIREYLSGFENLQPCGRNGLHRYNNQDHSMWTAILAAFNLAEGMDYDVWSVNTEEVYLEEGELVDALLDVDLVH